jgi:hypothetical protein
MLPKAHCQGVQNLLNALLTLQEQLGRDESLSAFEQVQQVFQEQILGLSGEGLDGALASAWQSMQTEIHRNLRLLATDLLFLASARQAATTQQRLGSVRDRVGHIIGYCQGMVENRQ